MGWTTPRDWVVGEVVTKAILDAHIRDNLRYLKGLDGTVTFSDGLNLGTNELTVNSLIVIGTDGIVNKEQVEDHTHADGDNCGTVAHSALTGLTTGDDHTQYQKENLLTAQGDMVYATGASAWAKLAKGTAGYYLKQGASIPEWAIGSGSLIKTGTFTNDTANGAQGVTGVGFQPDYIIVSTQDPNHSIAVYDGTRQMAVILVEGTIGLSDAKPLQPWTGVGDHIDGVFASLDADGFTVTWSGLTGTAPARTYFYVAFRA